MKIAILGFGVVGRGVYDIIKSELSDRIQTKYVLDIRPIEGIDCEKAQSIDQIINDPEVDLVVEAMGGFASRLGVCFRRAQCRKTLRHAQ